MVAEGPDDDLWLSESGHIIAHGCALAALNRYILTNRPPPRAYVRAA